MTQPQPKQLKEEVNNPMNKKECCEKCKCLGMTQEDHLGKYSIACTNHDGDCHNPECICHQFPDKGEITKEFPEGKESYCPQCYFEDDKTILRKDCPHNNSPDTFNTKECINGHKMTGVGFDDCCPEDEAPWKESGVEWLKFEEEFAKIYYGNDHQGFGKLSKYVFNLLTSSRSQVLEQIKEELKHIAMYHPEGKPNCFSVSDVLDLLERLKK